MTIQRFGQRRISDDMGRIQTMARRPIIFSDADIYASSSYDGDAFSTQAKTLVDVSATFVHRKTFAAWPYTARALYCEISLRDSGAGSTDTYIVVSDTSTANWGLTVRCPPANDRYASHQAWVPCDANGDFYLQIVASGASTLDLFIRICGYMPW